MTWISFQQSSSRRALLKADSVLGEMARLDDDCWNEIQVIGWLYQYYNTQLKDETFELLKKNIKITKERIGAATQLFTPEWIVRYMVENSLGRLWLEGHPSETLRMKWRYYMDEAPQEPAVAARLAQIRAPYAALQPDQLTVLDPCMGSGHILVYAFDVLMDIYRSVGYTDRDAVQSIVQNNLYGLDIDDRAAQLAYFAVMMKACEYDRRFLRRGVQPHVCAIAESVPLAELSPFGAEKALAQTLLDTFRDAKEYGSILHVPLSLADIRRLADRTVALQSGQHDTLLAMADNAQAAAAIQPLLAQAQILARQYDAVITNPPYMGARNMNERLSEFIKTNYPDSKSDLFAVFIERCGDLLDENGYQAMITQHAWMFLSSFERLRAKLQKEEMINMAHLGSRAFEEIGGEVVQTTAFVLQKHHLQGYKGCYARLIEPTTQDGKEAMFLAETNRYTAQQDNFSKIPGAPVAYWVSKNILAAYKKKDVFDSICHLKAGMNTSNNDKYLRMWFEINYSEFGGISAGRKWIKYLKGGPYRKWYGNLFYLLFYNKSPQFILQQSNAQVQDESFLTMYKCTWTDLTSGETSFRIAPNDSFNDISGHCFYPAKSDQFWLLGYTNTSIFSLLLKLFNSTMHCLVGDVAKVVIPELNETQKERISLYAHDNVNISKTDWDLVETSWDFQRHPMI